MANEITLSLSLNLTRSNVEFQNWDTGAFSLNQTGTRSGHNIMTATTTAAALELGSVGTLGYILVKNNDTYTNNPMYILSTAAATTGAAIAILYKDEICLFKPGSAVTAPAVVMATTAAPVEIMTFEF